MKLVSVSLIKNEEDIIPYMIDHHAPYLDLMIILDNQSTDNTPQILQEKQKEHNNLIVAHDHTPDFDFITKMDSLIKSAANHHNADWIIPIDADEFIIPIRNLRDTFKVLNPTNGYKIMWQNHIPTVDDNKDEENPIKRITYHLSPHYEKFNKMVIPQGIAQNSTITMGGHSIKPEPRLQIFPYHVLAHYPIRTPKQIYSKVMKLKKAVEYDKTHGNHYHVKDMYKQFTTNGCPSDEELTELLYQYTNKP